MITDKETSDGESDSKDPIKPSNHSDKPDDNDNDNDNDETVESESGSEYEVEKILAKRQRRRGGEFEYYIKWVGYDDSANEWIPESSLSCPERLAEFEKEEELRLKREKKKRKTIQRRSDSMKARHKAKKRRVNILVDDDDDNDKEDDFDDKVLSARKRSTSTTKSAMNVHQASITYGVERGYKVQAVLGLNRKKSAQLHYLVHYEAPTDLDDNMELIPATIAKKYCEDEIIQFYETRISWNR